VHESVVLRSQGPDRTYLKPESRGPGRAYLKLDLRGPDCAYLKLDRCVVILVVGAKIAKVRHEALVAS
jgi:hypothetical protein